MNVVLRPKSFVVGLAAAALLVAASVTFAARSGAADDSSSLSLTYNWLVESAPSPQAAALDDHRVERAEYVAAIAALRQCLTERGVWSSEPEWNSNGQLTFSMGGAPDRASLAPMKAIYEECNDLHSANIAAAWAVGAAPKSAP
jgi:hypothetical protein